MRNQKKMWFGSRKVSEGSSGLEMNSGGEKGRQDKRGDERGTLKPQKEVKEEIYNCS